MTVEDVYRNFGPEQWEHYHRCGDSEASSSFLAEVLNLKGFRFEARDAIKLDYASYVLEFAKEQKYGPIRTSSLFDIAQKMLQVCIAGTSYQDAEATLKMELLAVCRPKPGLDSPHLSPDQIARAGAFFATTLLSHYRLYQYCFNHEQDLTQYTDKLLVETPIIPSLEDALPEDEWDAKLAAEAKAAEDAAAAAAADATAAAAAAAAAAEERAREEAAAARAAELARKPETLEEAVQQMVALRLEEEKAQLAAMYRAKETELLSRIDALQGVKK